MKIFKVKNVKTPVRGTDKSAGIDFFVPVDFKAKRILAGESILIESGIKASIPKNHVLVAMNKSGVAVKRSLFVGACVIDEDFQGEILVHLHNGGSEPQIIRAGTKIVQMLLIPVNYFGISEVVEEHELYNGIKTNRGAGCLGSTGDK